MPLLMAAIDLCRPDLVILDGVRDLVDDINNGLRNDASTTRSPGRNKRLFPIILPPIQGVQYDGEML